MHVNRTFSLKLLTVQELNDKIGRKWRSQFVDRAISEALDPKNLDATQLSSRRLLSILHNREDVSDFCKRVILTEINDLQRKMKEELE